MAQDLANIHQQCFEKGWSENEFKHYITSPHHDILMVAMGEYLCGAIIFSEIEDTIEILTLFISPEFQRSGLGTALLKHLIEDKKNVAAKIWLEVSSINGHAVSLYTKAGFAIETVRKNYYKTESGAEDALNMTFTY